MKKIKTLFLLITLLASFSFGAAWTGANSEPESTQTIDGKKFYVITTPEELAWVAKQVNAGYNKMNAVLANDIVFGEDTASVNTEYAWTPIGKDGAGYSIYGVWTDSTLKYAGLVGILDSAGVVRNVNMKRNSINASDVAGGIVGGNSGTVSGCTNEGTVRVPGGDFPYAGGVVGYNEGGTVSGCTNEGSVTTACVSEVSYAGGIVGNNGGSKARVKNSYSRTDTLAFMGDAEAYRGGVAGVNTDKALIINCYYDSEKLPDVSAIGSDSATATDVSGMTTAEMQSDQFVLILNTTNGSEENSGLWSRDGGYPILVSVAKPGGSTALHVTAQPRFNLQVQNRTIWVQNARVGESFAVFDVQGHVLRRGVVNSAELFLSVQNAGAYIVRMGTETMRVRVK